MAQFGFFSDAGLTLPLLADLVFDSQANGSTGAIDQVVYFGSANAEATAQAASDPGVDPIEVSITDLDGGDAEPATSRTIALTQGGLSSAVPGDPLTLGTDLAGGTANAVEIWLRFTAADLTLGLRPVLALDVTPLQES
jgi:hypothetical protein